MTARAAVDETVGIIVTRIADARPYEAPGHFDIRSPRLQGFDASPSEGFWVGLDTDLGPLDSCYIAGGERRALSDRTNLPASRLVIMPHPPGPVGR